MINKQKSKSWWFGILLFLVLMITFSNISQTQAQPLNYCNSTGGCYDISIPLSVYQKQGNGDTHQSDNCGPASVVMAIRHITGQYGALTPETVRINGNMGNIVTNRQQLKNGLDFYNIAYTEINSFNELQNAVNDRHHIVITLLDMEKIDAVTNDFYPVNLLNSTECPDPLGRCVTSLNSTFLYGEQIVNRYWVYNGDQQEVLSSGRYNEFTDIHWVVLKGIQWTFGSQFKVLDPNVWSNSKYWYDSGVPKGYNRSYSYENFKDAFESIGSIALEITGSKNASFIPKENEIYFPNEATKGVNSLRFISHENFGSNETLLPNQIITKKWNIQNNGSNSYGIEYSLKQVGGPNLNKFGTNSLAYYITPNEYATIGITLSTPSQSGSYSTYWQFADSHDNTFGDILEFNFTIGDLSSDTTPPTGTFTSPANGATITTPSVTISANASDNAGGSGVKEVRFSAKVGGSWYGIGTATSSPYSINWDFCNIGNPSGDVELGMEVWDNANNVWIYSQHFSNPHITVNYTCGLPSPGAWNAESWMNKYMAGYKNNTESWSDLFIYKDWGTGAPYSGYPSDEFSFKIYRDVNFQGGHYYFRVYSDDGFRLLVDGQTRINEWWDHRGGATAEVDLSTGWHPVEIQYYENTGDATIRLWFWGPGIPRPELDNPDGRITLPVNNSYVSQYPLTIWADAGDDVAGVNKVVFRVYHCVGGCQWRELGTSYSPPYRFENWDWSSLNGQQVKFAIDVYDNSGKSNIGAGGEVIVNLDKTAPTVSITSPLSGTIDEDKFVSISVSAADGESGMASLKFYAGYTGGATYWHEIGNDTNSSDGWGLNWNASALPNGTKVDLSAVAYDRAGNTNSDLVYKIKIGQTPKTNVFLPLIINMPTQTPLPTQTPMPTQTPLPKNWSLINNQSRPPNRAGYGIVYDNYNNQIILFGGTCQNGACGDTWKFDNSGWQLITSTGPGPREDVVMAYDSIRHKTVLFGGHIWAGAYLNDTWEFNGTQWVKVTTTTLPDNRSNQAMAFDASRGKVVMFGGWRDSQTGSDILSGTWEYDGTNWVLINTTHSPSARTGARMVYVPDWNKIVLFGGSETSIYVNDIWTYDGIDWTKINTLSAPSPRFDSQMAYDPIRKKIVLFGGRDMIPTALGETWEFDGANWSLIQTTSSPPPTWDSAMIYFPSQNGVLLFGGNSPNQNDLNNNMWWYK